MAINMRRYRYRAARLFHIILWSVILILSLNVLTKGIRILGGDSAAKSAKSLGARMISSISDYMVTSNIPIMDYITSDEESKSNNFILNTMIRAFPINEYIAKANDGSYSNYIENKITNTNTLAKGFLFNNDRYVEMILEGIEREKSNVLANTDETDVAAALSTGTSAAGNTNDFIPIDIISGEVYLEVEDATVPHNAAETLGSINGEHFTVEQLVKRQFLYNNFYIVDSATTVNDELFDAKKLLGKDMTLKAVPDKPQILIYHTHSQEGFSDSRKGKEADTVVGLGTYLTKLLKENYGYNVIHDKTQYDIMGGTLDRNLAYNYAGEGVKKILEKNPEIEVVIDIHRDGANKRVANINGSNTAQIMLFNGLSRNAKGEIAYLNNPNLQDNLAFSLQLQLKGRELYPGLMYRNYLHAYRYNLHLRKKSILAEVGTDKNTVEEAYNAMDYLAVILHDVLSGEEAAE
ncbi:hypothetical protein acsn021_25230 [Anaerocolumna cellulosilytica]|uniref:Uncharacterized protein n=1 Tax=Anaerocolumna cellulosilytica TaxID=433286 RepID=A0A6S6QWF5_9FIRM|nr:stage II sporulation protein P [Anaerocolumna cellulosilytica]MBB5193830.1 stage II sporulation protein P [Anaerocolumna cellulosilytica]BCJ94954.1 hypothetical protein acsn021_25230 [Anaerocolumna cellulosilytica]